MRFVIGTVLKVLNPKVTNYSDITKVNTYMIDDINIIISNKEAITKQNKWLNWIEVLTEYRGHFRN